MNQIKLLLFIMIISITTFAQDMVFVVNTNLSPYRTIVLEMYGTVDVKVNWGDYHNNWYVLPGNQLHTYDEEGIYTITISGRVTKFNGFVGTSDKLTEVVSFGNLGLRSLSGAFRGAVNLESIPDTIPQTVTDLSSAFYTSGDLKADITSWDVSNVKNVSHMFHGSSFNQDIGNWDVSSVTNMSYMFSGNKEFNQDISNWNVSNVKVMDYMFDGCISFNQDIGNWDVSSVTDMSNMFRDASSFNQDISNWEVSKVTSMGRMFQRAYMFNQNIGKWDVGNVTSMGYMFNEAYSFSYDLGSWDVENVISMWDMFADATSFDQDLGDWNVSNVTSMTGMFDGLILSRENYSATLIGWSKLPLKNSVTFNAGNSQYLAEAADARRSIIENFHWNIIDGGEAFTKNMTLLLSIGDSTEYHDYRTIALPFNGDVDVTVDWGDGSSNQYSTIGSKSHFYNGPGIYTVTINGTLTQFGNSNYNYSLDRSLLKVASFGDVGLTSLRGAFDGMFNLIFVPDSLPNAITDLSHAFQNIDRLHGLSRGWDIDNITTWNLSNVTNLSCMFKDSQVFNSDIGSWDVSNVTNMDSMFCGATYFNQDLGNWDVSNVTTMVDMFTGDSLSTDNYSNLLIGWSKLNLQNNVTFNGGESKYYTGEAAEARQKIIDNYNWVITDGGSEEPNGIIHNNKDIPTEYSLSQNYPNPFNPTTSIEYGLSESTRVTIIVYDILGRKVTELLNEYKAAGNYKLNFDGSNLSSGIYLCRMVTNNYKSTIKMIITK